MNILSPSIGVLQMGPKIQNSDFLENDSNSFWLNFSVLRIPYLQIELRVCGMCRRTTVTHTISPNAKCRFARYRFNPVEWISFLFGIQQPTMVCRTITYFASKVNCIGESMFNIFHLLFYYSRLFTHIPFRPLRVLTCLLLFTFLLFPPSSLLPPPCYSSSLLPTYSLFYFYAFSSLVMFVFFFSSSSYCSYFLFFLVLRLDLDLSLLTFLLAQLTLLFRLCSGSQHLLIPSPPCLLHIIIIIIIIQLADLTTVQSGVKDFLVSSQSCYSFLLLVIT
jgi:hypothetical protein